MSPRSVHEVRAHWCTWFVRIAAAVALLTGPGCGGRSNLGDGVSRADEGGVPGSLDDAGAGEGGASTDAGLEADADGKAGGDGEAGVGASDAGDASVDAGDAGDAGGPPWTSGALTLKLDPTGPRVDVPASAAGGGVACDYGLGTSFGTFLSTCVQPWGPADPRSQAALSTLYAGITHGDEAYQLAGAGIGLQVYATSLAADDVLAGADRPNGGDTLSALDVESSVPGDIANDWRGNQVSSGVFDEHGSGMLYLEWASLVQRYMRTHGDTPVTTDLGDPDCIANPVRGQTANGKVCSGIEGILTNAPVQAATQTDPLGSGATVSYPVNALGWNGVPGASAMDAELRQGLRPGTWVADFCYGTPSAPGLPATACVGGGLNHPGQTAPWDPSAALFDPGGGTMLSAMRYAVKLSFGSAAVPAPLDDPGFFFEQWVRALVKYLQSAADASATLGAIDANPLDEDDLVFAAAGGALEQAEYVFRDDVATYAQPPTVLDVTANPTTSDIEDLAFHRYDLRGETLVYETQRTVPSDPVGLEPLFVTNLVGSPVLRSVFPSYACAVDPPSCSGPTPPPDQTAPAYVGYEAAFGTTVFGIAALGDAPAPMPFTVDAEGPAGTYPAIQSAMVTVPIFESPFDLTSAVTGQASALLHHVTPAAGGGFPITIDGARDAFFPTDAIEWSGNSFTATLDYEMFVGPDGGTEPFLRALEAPSFLGQVFACAAPSTTYVPPPGNPLLYGDVLAVHVNERASDVLAWAAAHPDATTACQLLVLYDVSSNAPAAITFLASGVRFDLAAGLEGPVVSSVTLFDPNVVAILSQ